MHRITRTLCAAALCAASLLALAFPSFAADANSRAGTVKITSGSLNVRSSPSTSAGVVASLYKNETVTLLSKEGNWWRVEYANGKSGYSSASYISEVSGSRAYRVKTSSGNLNVRTGPGTGYGVKASLPSGRTVVVLSQSGGWAKIVYNGKSTGYVSAAYLTTDTAAGLASVRLSVPSYKQTDSRWANILLGSSGETMAQSGCTTTALAMTESFRTGTTLTPADMAKKLTYAPAGWLYWPSNYVTSVNSANYLQTIYDLLRAGKPVILGMKRASGSQHWVVVTGFAGGSLSASNFYINDPGSSTRTTLSAFQAAYPNFYKIAYYR